METEEGKFKNLKSWKVEKIKNSKTTFKGILTKEFQKSRKV
jgi:hypothetical protein